MSLTCNDVAADFPEYEFIRELGDGTFKIACLVRDGDAEVVLKVSKAVIDEEQGGFPERLRREIHAMKGVDSPHIAKVLAGPSTPSSARRDWIAADSRPIGRGGLGGARPCLPGLLSRANKGGVATIRLIRALDD